MTQTGEFRREWGTVLAGTIGVMASCITLVNYSLGVFVVPLSTEFGWSRQQIMLATTCVSTGALATSFVAGWLADRFNIGTVIVVSQILFSLAFCALAVFGHSLPVFYGIYIAMAFVAGGTLPITFTKIVAARFVRRRGLAIGLTLAGTGVAGMFVPPYVGYFVNTYGWRVGFVAVASIPLCFAMPLAVMFLRRPRVAADPGVPPPASYGMDLGEALRSWRFWLIAVAMFIASAAATGISGSMVPVLIAQGFAPQQAANLAAAFGLAVIAGRIILGSLVDRFWAPPLACIFLFPAAVASLLLTSVSDNATFALILIVLIGLGTGAEGDLLAYLVTRYFGIRAYGQIFAGIFVAFIAAIAVAAPLFGYAYDQTKSYTPAMAISAAGWVLCGVLFLCLGPYPKLPGEPPR